MKKTIAKIMAAAMVLSAVPAVTLPTLTAKADDNITVTATPSSVTNDDIGASSFALTDTSLSYDEDDATIPVVVGSNAKITNGGHTLTVGDSTIELSASTGTTKNTNFAKLARLALDDEGQVYVEVNAGGSTDSYNTILTAIADGDNAVTITLTLEMTQSNGTAAAQKTTTINAFVGGTVGLKGATATTGVRANGDKNEVVLANGDVYAKFGSSGIEILRGANSDLDDMDYFRSYTLDLTKVNVGAAFVGLPVVKIGAQALKKAHMKKFYAENVKTIGKGALRNAKQVKHVDICDSNKVRKIHEKAFLNCKNLKTIIIDGRKLNTVGKNAFSGVKKNATLKIKAKKSKFNSDVKMIKKNGGNKNLKYVRK